MEMVDKDLLEAFFEDVGDVLDQWVKVTLSLNPNDGGSAYSAVLRCAHNLKGSSGLVGLTKMHATMHAIEDQLVKLRDLNHPADTEVVTALLETEKMLQTWIKGLKTDPEHNEDTKKIEQLWAKIFSDGELDTSVPSLQAEATPRRKAPLKAAETSKKTTGDESLRVAVPKLDRVIQLAGEIALHQAMLDRASREGQLNSQNVRHVIDHTTKLTQDLQDASLSLRMIPIEGLFQKIERVVRETSVKLKKPVRIERIGGEVTLDKIVVEGMLDPMIHLARNAVDHGIELANDRLAAGKKGEGHITISAESTASGVTLVFADDGRGIDGEKVFAKAVSLGLVAQEDNLTPTEKLQLIFLPGLSTADKITDVSGRGVGMDVVGESVRRLGGRVELESTIGKGTRIVIALPTNLSIVDALVVRVGGQQYAVPNQDLSEVVDLREFNVQPVKGDIGQAIDFRGRIVPVAAMNSFLNEPVSLTEATLPKPGIIVHHREEWLAIAVDAVVGQQQIFVRPMHGHLSEIGFYSGSTILSDGEPTIILNLPAMVQDFFTMT